MAKQTWVYLIKDDYTGFHKIGFSDNPENRVRTISKQKTLLPIPSDFHLVEAWLAVTDDEAYLHKYFARKRVRGEWFALTDEDVEWIGDVYFYLNKPRNDSYNKFRRDTDERVYFYEHGGATDAQMLDFVFEGFGVEF